MVNLFLVATNAVVFVAFTAAAVGALTTPARPGGMGSRGVNALFAVAMAVFAFVGLSHVLQHAGITSALDTYENYVKVLFFPLLGYATHALSQHEQLRETRRHALVLSAEHEMLMRIVDTTPTALLVLDGGGRIEFANERARLLLELEDDENTGGIRQPDVYCTCGGGREAAPGFGRCLRAGLMRDETCLLESAEGECTRVLLNSSPIESAEGDVVGAIVAFDLAPAARAV